MRKDALRRREMILEAALHAYMSRREALTMEEVATAAGVGIATVYRNFPTREILISEVLATITYRLTSNVQAATAALIQGEEDVFEQILALMSEVEVDRLLIHVINRDPTTLSPAHAALHQDCTQHIEALLAAYRARGGIADDIDDATFTQGLLGCFAAARATEGSPNPLQPAAIARIFLAGAARQPH